MRDERLGPTKEEVRQHALDQAFRSVPSGDEDRDRDAVLLRLNERISHEDKLKTRRCAYKLDGIGDEVLPIRRRSDLARSRPCSRQSF